MTSADVPVHTIWKQRAALFIASLGFGCLAAWLGTDELVSALRGSAAGAAVIEFRPTYFRALPCALAGFALAMMTLLPSPKPLKRRSKFAAHSKAQEFMFGVFVCSVPFTILAPVVGRVIMSDVMTGHDYRVCPTDIWRYPPMRWVRTHLPCPAQSARFRA